MKTKFTHPLIAASLPAVMAVPLAHAQSADLVPSPTTDTLDTSVIIGTGDEVNVPLSALRTGTPLKDTPRSITVVGAEEIKERNFTSIGQIVDYTPGLNTSQGEGHRDSVVFRGVRSTADFFLDGIRDDVQYYRPLYNLEAVEVLRGPSALLFGRGGAGGVINRVSKKAELGDNFGEFTAKINSFGGTYGAIDYNWALSEKAALRVNIFNETLENHRDFFDGNRFGFNPTFHYKFSPDTTLDVSYEYVDHDRFIDRGVPQGGDGDPASQFDNIVFGDSDLNRTGIEAHIFRATLRHDFSENWKGSVTGFYGTYDKFYRNYFASDFNTTEGVEIDGYLDTTQRERFQLSGDLIGEFSTGNIDHKLLIGAEYIRTNSDQDRWNNVWDSNGLDRQFFNPANFRLRNGVVVGQGDSGTFSALNDDTRVNIDVYSFFIQDEIALTDKLDLILGARFDSFDIEVDNREAGTDFGVSSRKDQEISPRAGLVFKPIEPLTLYASYSESFLPRSGEQFADINGSDATLDPDTFSNLEFGLKWFLKEDLLLSFAAFQIEESSPQANDDEPGTLSVIDSEIKGIELQLQGKINDWWYISAGYSFLDGRQIDEFGDDDGRLRELPEHTFAIWNNFQVTNRLNIGFGMTYQDESFADLDNEVTLPSYVRFDASASYNFSDDLRVQLNIENLFDTDYFPNAHTANNITVGAPLNATLSLTKKF